MSDFVGLSDLRIDAPLEAVWEVLAYPEGWPFWWPHLAAVTQLTPGDVDGVGAGRRFVWRLWRHRSSSGTRMR